MVFPWSVHFALRCDVTVVVTRILTTEVAGIVRLTFTGINMTDTNGKREETLEGQCADSVQARDVICYVSKKQ